MPRLREKYEKEVIPALMKKFNYKNVMQVPRLEKVVLNMGISDAKENPKAIESATRDLAMITGQKPVVTKAKKSIASFKIRKGMAIGAKVTLRGNRMYEFLDRLIGKFEEVFGVMFEEIDESRLELMAGGTGQ